MQAIHIKLGKAVIMENREIINAYIDKWIEDYNSRQRAVWNYEDGCVMLGAQYLYEATGDEKYINCIRTFMDRYIQEDGTIRYYVPEDYNLDKVNNGRVLYFLYDKTGEEKYKVDKVRGMDIIFVTTAKTDEEARELLTLFNMPFAK